MLEYYKSVLPKEYLMLWELSKTKKLEMYLIRPLRDMIQRAKHDINSRQKNDELREKLARYSKLGSWSKFKQRELDNMLYEYKSPSSDNLGNWVSVEIECIFESESKLSEFTKFVKQFKLKQFITIKNDASVTPDGTENEELCEQRGDCQDENCHYSHDDASEIGKEIVVTFQIGHWFLIKMVCNELNRLGCYVNKSCGLHVHFDMRHKTKVKVTNIGKRIALVVPALKQLLPKSRQANSFCRDTINSHKRGSRYSFVNLQSFSKHKTIEIRGHSGSTSADKIINWIKLIKVVIDSKNKKELVSALELIDTFKLSPELINYVVERFNKFKPKTDGEVLTDAISDDVTEDNAFTVPLVYGSDIQATGTDSSVPFSVNDLPF